MNRPIALPGLLVAASLSLVGCAHLSSIPSGRVLESMNRGDCLRAPSPEEIERGLKGSLNTSVIYRLRYAPPRKIYWNSVSSWRWQGTYYCGWAIQFIPTYQPLNYMAFFQADKFLGVINHSPDEFLGTGRVVQAGQSEMFVIASTVTTGVEWVDLELNESKLRAMRIAEERERQSTENIAAGGAVCEKVQLRGDCFTDFAPGDFYRDFGARLSDGDKSAYYNAWKEAKDIASEKSRRKEEAEAIARGLQLNAQMRAADAQQRATNLMLLNTLQQSMQPAVLNTNCVNYGYSTNCRTTGY